MEEKEMKARSLSRRDMFKVGGLATVGAIGAAGLAACSKKPEPEPAPTPDPTPTPAPSGGGSAEFDVRRRAALLNPQDYDFCSATTDMATIFSPWKMGKLEIGNRIVKSAAGMNAMGAGPNAIPYFVTLAKNEVKMMYSTEMYNFYDSFDRFIMGRRCDEAAKENMRQLTKAVHDQGALIGYQMSTFDMNLPLYVPSPDDFMPSSGCMDWTYEDIKQFQKEFIAAGKILKDVGFDAIEINSAATNLGACFLNRKKNKWDNEYGAQNLENRTRFVVEQIKGIKELCGADFPVQVLMNGIEENDTTIGDSSLMSTVNECIEIAKIFEAAGADSLHIRIGTFGMHPCQFAPDLWFSGYGIEGTTSKGDQFDFKRHWQGKLVANHGGYGIMVDVAAEIKKHVNIPVGVVTGMDPAKAPDYFENILKEGKVDFMLMHRPLQVDPTYVRKLKEGRRDEIAPCTRCMHCHWDLQPDGSRQNHCRVNTYTTTYDGAFEPPMANPKKNVMVIGGGPAGMRAASVAAQRGHNVTLYEKKGSLGGLLDFANMVKGPHENLDRLRDYLIRDMEVKGVKVVTGKEVDAAFIKEQAPDAVILAVGGLRDSLGAGSTGSIKVVSITDFMATELGDDIVVLGSGAQAMDTVMYLLAQGKQVKVVTPSALDRIGFGHSSWVCEFTQPMIKALGTKIYPSATGISVGSDGVSFTSMAGVKETVPCDTVIEAWDMLPNTKLIDGLGIESYAVGDCIAPWNILEALRKGHDAALAV